MSLRSISEAYADAQYRAQGRNLLGIGQFLQLTGSLWHKTKSVIVPS